MAIGFVSFVAASCSSGGDSSGDGHSHDSGVIADASHPQDDASHAGLILLDTDRAAQLGIETEVVSPGEFVKVLKVSGEIAAMPGSQGVVSARQGGIVRLAPGITEGLEVSAGRVIATVSAKGMSGGDPEDALRVAYQAAKRELDRLTPLHQEGIVSTKEYNAALQRVEETRVALGASGKGSGGAATAPVAGVLTSISVADGQYVESGQPIAVISSNRALTLRADLPESALGELAGITGARFRPSYSREFIDVKANGGEMVSRPGAASAQGGYIPLYFTLPAAGSAGVVNGSYCEVYLTGQPRHDVISVAEDAVSEQQGKYFVYVELSPGHYEKRPVDLGSSDGFRREIKSGLKEGDRVVGKGMIYVRLAETSGVVPEGHSHSH